MITSIIVLGLLAIKDEIVGIIELFSTLQGNILVYRIVTFIGILTAMFEIRFISVYEGSWQEYTVLMVIVALIGSEAGAQILKFKSRIRNWLRKKRISNSMKKKWEEKKSIKQETVNEIPIQPILIEEAKDLRETPPGDNDGSIKDL